MAYEIERKFLVKDDSFKELAYESSHIIQGYICKDPNRTVRIRIKDNFGFITIKGLSSDDGISRFEWEKQIPVDEAKELMKLCEKGAIDKTRYKVRSDSHIFEIDVFHAENEGLVLAEVELNSASENPLFPSFIGKEVTGDKRYYNSYISDNPFKNNNS